VGDIAYGIIKEKHNAIAKPMEKISYLKRRSLTATRGWGVKEKTSGSRNHEGEVEGKAAGKKEGVVETQEGKPT